MLRLSHLQTKLILAFVLVLLIPTGIIAFYSLSTASSTLIGKISAEELRSVVAQANTIEKRIIDVKNDVLFLSQAPSTRRYVNSLDTPGELQQAADGETTFFQAFLKRSTQYVDITILSLSGREIVHVSTLDGEAFDTIPAKGNQSGYAYFNQAIGLLAGQVYISGFELNANDGTIELPYTPIVRYSTPLQADNGNVVGVLAVKSYMKPMLQDITAQEAGSETYLIDKDGSYLLHPDPSKLYGHVLKNKATLDDDQPNDIRQMFGARQGTILGSQDRPDSLQVFAHIKPVGQIAVQWLLVRQKDVSTILTEVNNAQFVILALAGAALIVAIAVAVFFTRNIVRPVRQLVQTADAISRGEWETPIPTVTTRDEISHLATAFERMLRELRTLYNDLENRVAARTAELEAANKQLVITKGQAEQASRAKSVFLSNMSHELRTPLNVIIGYSSSMLDVPQMFGNVPLPEIYQPYLKLIETNGHYLLGLINDSLDLSKVESGNIDLRFACVSLPDIFRGVISTSIGLLKGKPVHIQPDFSDNLPLVWADAMRVRQIILNLMSNAIKFTDSGQVTLAARVEGNWVRIAVSDTGIGIPEKALATIFDRFKQAEYGTSKQYGGTGLGLDISKQFSLLHGSDLTVESTVGKGTTFAFALPIATSEQLHSEPQPVTTDGAVSILSEVPTSVGQTAVILVLEDEMTTRDVIHRLLEGAGHVVVNASEADQAVTLATGLLPALIVLGGEPPSLDREAVLDALHKDPDTRHIPILIITGRDEHPPLADKAMIYTVMKANLTSELAASVTMILVAARAAMSGD
ncbi:MAG: HAMP domain-containing protein [Anaerolineae bacterium]|nr:HAMP domain-containing protein [Anaerolineae bacterium]